MGIIDFESLPFFSFNITYITSYVKTADRVHGNSNKPRTIRMNIHDRFTVLKT